MPFLQTSLLVQIAAGLRTRGACVVGALLALIVFFHRTTVATHMVKGECMRTEEHLARYAMDYVKDTHDFTDEQARLFILNPDATFKIDMQMAALVIADEPQAIAALKGRDYSARCLIGLNGDLDFYVRAFPNVESQVRSFVREVQHEATHIPGKAGCLVFLAAILSFSVAVLLIRTAC